MSKNETPLWEVFIRPRNGLSHKHCGSLHAADASLPCRGLDHLRGAFQLRGGGRGRATA